MSTHFDIVEGLAQSDVQLKVAALQKLGRTPGLLALVEVRTAVLASLKHSDLRVRRSAGWALSRWPVDYLRHPMPELESVLEVEDQDAHLLKYAVSALRHADLKAERIIELTKRAAVHPNPDVRLEVVITFGALVCYRLKALLEKLLTFQEDTDPKVAKEATYWVRQKSGL